MSAKLRHACMLIALVGAVSTITWHGCSGGAASNTREPGNHRPQALSCVGVFAPPEPENPQNGTCKKHADCPGPNGRCDSYYTIGRSYYTCTYDQCATDADCPNGKVCFCSSGDSARCFDVGNCRTDADCGIRAYCSPAYGPDCAGQHSYTGYFCHTAADTCFDDNDCGGDSYCNYDEIFGRWECMSPDLNCAIG